MATPFPVPWTLNDENEFSLPVLPWYFTSQELGLAILGTIASYLALAPLLGLGIINVGAMVVCGVLIVHAMMVCKKGKPSSWLWDLRMGLGLLPEARGLMRARRGVRWLQAQHLPRASVFLAGAARSGDDLSVSAPWMAYLPPLVAYQPLLPPRRRRRWSREPAPAPIWFHGANGFDRMVEPRLPLSCAWEIPASEPTTAPEAATPPRGSAS